jgi:tRNA(fMet)-specific endonuclease VapC
MMVLDTDHISILEHEDSRQAVALTERLEALPEDEIATTAVTLEEQARSWLALIGRNSDVRQQVAYYERFVAMFDFFAAWQVLRFDDRAAVEFQRLRSQRVRIATTDLKIASIALVQDATLLSSNLRDFKKCLACALKTGCNHRHCRAPDKIA